MKSRLIICLILIISLHSNAKTPSNYSVNGQFIYGNILKHTTHLSNLVKGPILGGEIDFQWQTMGERPWHQYYNFPVIGVGLVGLDLGNPEMLGQLMAIYPYLEFIIIDLDYVKLSLKGGAGASFLNKRFDNTASDLNNLNTGNAAIGSILNVYFAGGLNLELPLQNGFSLLGGVHLNHASNGSFYQPNSGINMTNTTLGLKFTPNFHKSFSPIRKTVPALPQKFDFELTVSGGLRELYYKDDKMYPAASLVLAAYRQMGNKLRLGLGLDGFYDGVYDGTTKFQRSYLTSNELKNKLRLGLSLRPEMVFGRITAGMHFGIYIYNPLRNIEPYNEAKVQVLNKGLIYAYDIEKEDGWLYTRATLKYALAENLFLSLGLKTHLQKAEFVEWGIGYKF